MPRRKPPRHRSWSSRIIRKEGELNKKQIDPEKVRISREVRALIAEIDRCDAKELPLALAWHILKVLPDTFEEIRPLEAKRIAEENGQLKTRGLKPRRVYWVARDRDIEGLLFFSTKPKIARVPEAYAVIGALGEWYRARFASPTQ